MYTVVYTKQAIKDIEDLKCEGLSGKAKSLVELIKKDPFGFPPPYEKLIGNLCGLYSRRINIKHRLVYELLEDEKIIKIIRLRTHYDNI